MADTTDTHDYYVSEEDYYKLLAYKNEAEMHQARFKLALQKLDSAVSSLLTRASENGTYEVSGNFIIDENLRTIHRTPVG